MERLQLPHLKLPKANFTNPMLVRFRRVHRRLQRPPETYKTTGTLTFLESQELLITYLKLPNCFVGKAYVLFLTLLSSADTFMMTLFW